MKHSPITTGRLLVKRDPLARRPSMRVLVTTIFVALTLLIATPALASGVVTCVDGWMIDTWGLSSSGARTHHHYMNEFGTSRYGVYTEVTWGGGYVHSPPDYTLQNPWDVTNAPSGEGASSCYGWA